ncbi:MAG: carboxypeptidase regulatory-like domain-containing protein [Candidatus Stygibacter australis]|nr:carboxypeptidase regulatory-like domain-containing protein [Candidatus Stygibacter australis]
MKKILLAVLLICWVFLMAETVIDESFDSPTMPTGWTQEYENSNISWMPYAGGHNGNPAAPHSGARNAYIYGESCITKLVTPMLNIGGSNSATLSFWYAHVAWQTSQDILKIYYKTEPDDDWSLIATYDTNITAWTHVNINLQSETSSYFVAFEAECHWGHGVVLDDVEIVGDPSPVGVVSGHVYNASGIPLTGAEVLIEDVGMSALTAPGGSYTIVAVPEGYHPFFASLDGYGFDMTNATVIAGETVTVDFNLQEYVEVMVSGTVISELDGEPVQGATINLEGFADYEGQTAANGQFLIPGVFSSNTYELSITKPNYNPYYDSIEIEEENYNCGTMSIFEPITITGLVNTTADPDSGLAGAQVTLEGYATHTTNTAANGQFIIPDLYANENYSLEITYDNHNPYEANVIVEGDNIDLGTLTLISPVSLTGHVVTNLEPGVGVEGATVQLTGFDTHNTVTDSLGDFEIDGIYANEVYELTISFTNHHVHTEMVNIVQDDIDLGTITLIAPVDITGWVNTTAYPDSGQAGAQVTLDGYETHNVQTAANGQFLITSVYSLEEYNLEITYPNHNPYLAVVDVQDEDIDLGTLTLISPVNLTGHVVSNLDPETGLLNADIDLTGYAYHTTDTDSLGNFTIDAIYANEDYEISIDYPDHNIYTQTIDVEQDNIDLGTITLIGPVTVYGYVYGSDDLVNGLADADIELTGNGNHSTTTDSTGYYEFTEVFANQEYTVDVEAENFFDYTVLIEVESVNLEVEDIILEETTSPAGNVNAAILDEFSTQVSWNTPGGGSTYEFRYDDGNVHDEIGINAPRAVIGAVHEYYAIVNQVKWFLTNAHTHPTVKIKIFGITSNGMPNSDNILYESGLIPNVNNQWRTYTLPTPVSAPNGFFVGISTPNRWTDLGMDDGDGEPWVFQPGTQFSTTDFETNVWNDISGYPDAGNLMLRAYGLNIGPPLNRELEGYKLFRMVHADITDPDEWEVVAENLQDTTYTDTTWWYLDEGTWHYAVRCQHTNGVESIATFSNGLDKDDPPTFEADFYITDPDGNPLQYCITSLTGFYHTYNSNSDAQGLADYTVNPGVYDLHISRNGYEDYDLEDILIVEDIEMDIMLENTGENEDQITSQTCLQEIYPNPFNPETTLSFNLKESSYTTIEVYNLKGQKIASVIDQELPAGSHSITWDAAQQPSGIYFIKFQADGITQLSKAVLLK